MEKFGTPDLITKTKTAEVASTEKLKPCCQKLLDDAYDQEQDAELICKCGNKLALS